MVIYGDFLVIYGRAFEQKTGRQEDRNRFLFYLVRQNKYKVEKLKNSSISDNSKCLKLVNWAKNHFKRFSSNKIF